MACPRCDVLVQRKWKYCDTCGFQLKESKLKKSSPRFVLPDLFQSRRDIYIKSRAAKPLEHKAARRKPKLSPSSGPRSSTASAPGAAELEAVAALLERERRALELANASRARQERVISWLEASNFEKREASRARPVSEPLWTAALTTGTWAAPKLARPPPGALSSGPPYQPPPRTYTEWHLKTVYGEHDFAERAKSERTKAEQAYASCRSDRRAHRLRLRDKNGRSDDDQATPLDDGQSVSRGELFSSRAAVLSTAGNSWPAEAFVGQPSLIDVLAAGPIQGAVFSLNPIRVAPGTPLTGPQSMPAHLTTPGAELFLSSSPSRRKTPKRPESPLPGSRVSMRSRSAEGSRLQSASSPVRKTPQPNSLREHKTTEGNDIYPPHTFKNLDSDVTAAFFALPSQRAAWFWGRTEDNDASVALGDTEKSEERDGEPTNPAVCGMFWRGDDRVATLVKMRENDKVKKAEIALIAAEAREAAEAEAEDESLAQDKAAEATQDQDVLQEDDLESRACSSAASSTADPQDFVFGQLRSIAMRFIAPEDLKPVVRSLQRLKSHIAKCFEKEVDMGKELESLKNELDRRKSVATVGVAEVQVKLSNEHAKLMHLDARLAQLRKVEDEFTERDLESLEEEARLLERQVLIGRRINKAEARLATALAVEMRVAGECELELRDAKTVHMAARQDTVRSYRMREDAVYALHLEVRGAAATAIQDFVRGQWEARMSQRNSAVFRLDSKRAETDAERFEAASIIQRVCRSCLARQKVVELAKSTYEKLVDEESGAPYYWNAKTGEAQWTKPRLFEENDNVKMFRSDPSKPTPVSLSTRRIRMPSSTTEAASMIQGVYRALVARRRMIELTKVNFEKLYDKDSGAYFYWNAMTGEAQWTKPNILGDKDDIEVTSSE